LAYRALFFAAQKLRRQQPWLGKKRLAFHKPRRAAQARSPQGQAMTANTIEPHRGRELTTHASWRLKKILVPTDFSSASKNAFRYALRFAKEFGAELTVLYVAAPIPSPSFAAIPGAPLFSDYDFSGAEKNLQSIVASAGNGAVKRPRWKVRAGIPSHEIVELAKDANFDLIVIATHGYTGWKHFCIGSTAERVVRAAPCPVLVVREKEHEFC
jgi:universal stress protein A